MPTILKSFQYSVLFHFFIGVLFVVSFSKIDKSNYQTFQNKISINLSGLKAGNQNGVSGFKENKTISKSVKKNTYASSEVQTDRRNELSSNSLGRESSANGGDASGFSSGDFNESILNYYEPQYPKAALRRGLQGELKIKILIGTDGDPIDIQILQSSGHKILDESALEAVRKWIFKAKKNNTYYVVKTIIFQINNRSNF